ncbi:CDP-2,3-bis-(O-geranylgeranyl)-sn-glycerol synthase [Desulfurococcaceae archaeon MEX13E-LK6-19]|nr:CDP-2,3-bis-(O-geranylgeranyl)-sn-glycerol synthase [Desulfurococcaceae archaeon MEX13E-LK6-19]
MIANAMPVLLKKGRPIDSGKLFIDGKRILGDGKTWEGLLIGSIGGFLASLAVSLFFREEPLLPIFFAASIAGLLGDICESFFKRRLGIQRGEPLPVFDQLDFAIGATILYMITGLITIAHLFFVVFSFTIILLLHITTNVIAYNLGLKDKPW